MYKVTLRKYVWDGDDSDTSTQWVLFTRALELPFAPMPGLTIALPMQRDCLLRSSTWVAETQVFICNVEDQYMTDLEDYFEDWIEDLSEAGWRLEAGPHPKN